MALYDTAQVTDYMTYLLEVRRRALIDVYDFMREHPAFEDPVGGMDPDHFELLYRRLQSVNKRGYYAARAGRLDSHVRMRIDWEWAQWEQCGPGGSSASSSVSSSYDSSRSRSSRSTAGWDDGRSVSSGSSRSTMRPSGRPGHSARSLKLLNDAHERPSPRLIGWHGDEWDDRSVASHSSRGSKTSRSGRSSASRVSASRTLWDGQSRSSWSSSDRY